jgi:hypothetical protein
MSALVRHSFVLCILFLAAGCGGGDTSNRPPVAPAEGVVTVHGKPVEGATVVFIPTEGSTYGSYGAAAVTDDEGRFAAAAFPPDPGAVPGSYTVTISKTEAEVEPEGRYEDVMYQRAPPAKSAIPSKYANPKESGLTADVPEEGKTDFQFDL